MNKRRSSGLIKSAEAGNWEYHGRRDGIIAEPFVFSGLDEIQEN